MTSKKERKPTSQPGAGYFALNELRQLNSGYYHDSVHALEVAGLVCTLAGAYGRDSARAEFLKQVALIHDADPRTCPTTGEAREGTPARVQVTLSWMEKEREKLQQRFDWSDLQFKEAQALIARTDYPFDNNPRRLGTRFDGMSPVEVYRQSLTKLPEARRAECMLDALLLRFSDQIAAYLGTFQRARKSVRDLVNELNNTGLSLNFQTIFDQTPRFLNQVGRDLAHDEVLKSEFGLHRLDLPKRTDLVALLGWKRRLKLTRNFLQFKFGAERAPLKRQA